MRASESRRAHNLRAAALLVVSLSVSCVPGPAPPPPKLEFVALRHAAGRVAAGETVTHAFEFRNTGGLDLSIDNIRAACGCTAAMPSARIIPPGESGAIDVRFDTTHEFGPQAHSISVYSNDPLQPVTTLTLAADIDSAVGVEPAELYVGHVTRGQSPVNHVRLAMREPATLGTLDATGRVFQAVVDAHAPQPQLAVIIRADAPLGRFRESMRLRTGSLGQPLVTIPVVGFVDR